jgi:hypothetical protein
VIGTPTNSIWISVHRYCNRNSHYYVKRAFEDVIWTINRRAGYGILGLSSEGERRLTKYFEIPNDRSEIGQESGRSSTASWCEPGVDYKGNERVEAEVSKVMNYFSPLHFFFLFLLFFLLRSYGYTLKLQPSTREIGSVKLFSRNWWLEQIAK